MCRTLALLLLAACTSGGADSGAPPVLEAWSGTCTSGEVDSVVWIGFTSLDPAALVAAVEWGSLEATGQAQPYTGTILDGARRVTGECSFKGACWHITVTPGETDGALDAYYGGDGYGSSRCDGTVTRVD